MKKSPKKPAGEDLQLLKINENRFEMFLEGLDNYEFKVYQHPAEYKIPMDSKMFFEHFYGVLKMYVNQENDLSLGRILVLYGVRAFEQKVKTNIFIVSFIYGLEQYYFQSREIEFVVEIINSFGDQIDLMKRKLQKWLNIKERVVLHYTDQDGYSELSLDSLIVNCNEWANLFKGLSYLFNNYETQMIKRLIKKYNQLKIEETNNVLASIFAKAVFLLHEDLINEEARKQPDNNENLNQLIKAEARKTKGVVKGEKEIKEIVEKAKTQYIEVKPTLGRKAHRESDNIVMVDVAELESKKVNKMKNEELLQQLDALDGKIYKEGRAKRNMQEQLDLAQSKLKENSKEYDELFDLTVKMCKDYKKMIDFAEANYPDALQGLKPRDFSRLLQFESNANLYQKSYKMNIIK